jgi:thioredoxin 1
MMLMFVRTLLVLTMCAALAACAPSAAPTAQPTPTVPEATPEAAEQPAEEATPTPESASAAVNQTVAFTFYDSYAAWCGTCRVNEPTLQSLTRQFEGRIAFVRVDVDNPADTPTREKYGLYDRSQYALVNAQGEVVKRWFGFLNEARVASELQELLSS